MSKPDPLYHVSVQSMGEGMAFTQRTIDFLSENRARNDKAWFEEHKPDYQKHVLEPMAAFVTRLTPALLSIDDALLCEPKSGKAISRIYRDTRFSHDKSLYRDVMWCGFMRNKKLYNGMPGFFFEVSPRGFRYGSGYYQASPQSMDSIRRLILDRNKHFVAALKAYETQDRFQLEADSYKRRKYPDQPENVQNWLDRKSICFIHNSADFTLLFSEDLADTVAEGFLALRPMHAFLIEAESWK